MHACLHAACWKARDETRRDESTAAGSDRSDLRSAHAPCVHGTTALSIAFFLLSFLHPFVAIQHLSSAHGPALSSPTHERRSTDGRTHGSGPRRRVEPRARALTASEAGDAYAACCLRRRCCCRCWLSVVCSSLLSTVGRSTDVSACCGLMMLECWIIGLLDCWTIGSSDGG
ncbi:uncharacterized protein K452DRAFT_114905 [Aplosporella prunicola CBS 121167]|uniref:Uncharacterized protein n=1 Tax=Aplosporella prunicola CBS 121167 TaxID=1176127 RepID=A0A6A6AZE6_9PEZI|nr:uncharacterized protein K452DRAFT_114905 [Aplosporella prunicola CBS 121167]KAF2137016.1 hypothetical protein K452DRAFT_114905 [Aplosporella prunicola CBS 121167]